MSVASNTSTVSEIFAEAIACADRQKALFKKLAKAMGGKKTRTPGPPGPGSAWTQWTAQAKTLFPEAYAEHLAGLPPDDKGAPRKNDPMGFASKARASTHTKEWEEFEAKWKEEHPKAPKAPKVSKKAIATAVTAVGGAGAPPSDSSDSSDGETSAASKKSGLPRAAPAPAAKAKGPTKAQKAAAKAAADAASLAAAKADPPTRWTYRGKNYLKNTKEQVWRAAVDGSVSEWYGVYDGKNIKKTDGPA